MALATGDRLGPSEIQSALGAGGMGEVFRARDTRLDRTVAIKCWHRRWPRIRSSASVSSAKREPYRRSTMHDEEVQPISGEQRIGSRCTRQRADSCSSAAPKARCSMSSWR